MDEEHRCCICKKAFKTEKALCGHMRTHPRSWRGVKPPPAAVPAEQQGRDVRESAEAEERGRNVPESAAAEQSIPVRKSAPINQRAEDVNPRRLESVVNQLLLLAEKSRQRPQGADGGSSENKITSHSSTARGGGGGGNGEVIMKDGFNQPASISVVAAGAEAGAGAGVAVGAIIAARNGTVSDVKKGTSSKKKGSSSSSAAGGSGAHTCEKCGRTFATGQSLGGHMRKHYEGPLIIINKKRAREQREETPAPTVDSRVREPAPPTGRTVALMAAEEVSCLNAPLESHNPALLSQSAQASDGGDCGRNKEEPERSSASNGACRLLDLDLNELAEPEEEPKNAPQLEPERKDDDGDDDELLSLRLGQFDIRRSSRV
ncbi:uncharacterized protein LOC109725224 [Ananas comosus]|uniref:Uncharacterized protein LOC109725224 n=1 Tax=Ananas comosus TaxID=4615 RepID=A0A6P5GPT7_ANACO|nr:uncharacterized protein LOC109725224 [Ananas comosus]